MTKKHWIDYIVPPTFKDIKWYMPWQVITWLLLGNDDDGPLGTGPKSGQTWLHKWGDTPEIDKYGEVIDNTPGEISLKRLLYWNLRNPLHNLTFYVIGISYLEEIAQYEVFTIGKRTKFFYDSMIKGVWPMEDYGISLVLRQYILPFLAVRIPIGNKRIEFYIGWRERGALGAAFRIKTR